MAWRIVKQPNGKFARFSDVVDDFTEYDMSRKEAFTLCAECMTLGEAKGKVQRAIDNPDRFDGELKTIQAVHGNRLAIKRRRQMSH